MGTKEKLFVRVVSIRKVWERDGGERSGELTKEKKKSYPYFIFFFHCQFPAPNGPELHPRKHS